MGGQVVNGLEIHAGHAAHHMTDPCLRSSDLFVRLQVPQC